MEELKKLESDYGFKLVLIDAKGMISRTREILEEKGSTVPLLIDSGFYSRNVLKAMYTPTLLVVDGEGRLRARLVGTAEDMEEIVREIIKRVS